MLPTPPYRAVLPTRRILLAGLGASLSGCAIAGAAPPEGARAPVGGGADETHVLQLSRLAFVACLDQAKPQPLWPAIAAARPEALVMLGDNVYADNLSGDPALPEMRVAYAALAAEPGFAALRARVPVFATWDDHDYGLNDAGAEFAHKAEAKRQFADFFGLPGGHPVRAREGVYRSILAGPEGARLQILVLDTRWFRSPLTPTDRKGAPGRERYLPDRDPDKTMLGPAQWAWLAAELARPADLRLIVSSIQVLADGHGWEGWSNLPLERARLFRLIRDTGARNVVFVSGDRHVGALYLEPAATDAPLVELTVGSMNRPAGRSIDEAGRNRLGDTYNEVNFGLLTIDWGQQVFALELRDAAGTPVRSTQLSLRAV
ncbi:MAG: alkaline phosphatase family protein [Alphaproteobacteria bacterium]|nr:alkaline phosphatase family protein [Alphaproteobacteria bacterium]